MSTRLISVRGLKRAYLESDPNFVYVGRRCGQWPGSIWGNPFKFDDVPIVRGVPGDVVSRFEYCLRTSLIPKFIPFDRSTSVHFAIMAELIYQLQGKTLGCWCGHWEPGQPGIRCHGYILAMYATDRIDSPLTYSSKDVRRCERSGA